jgi:hypothetical protein
MSYKIADYCVNNGLKVARMGDGRPNEKAVGIVQPKGLLQVAETRIQ